MPHVVNPHANEEARASMLTAAAYRLALIAHQQGDVDTANENFRIAAHWAIVRGVAAGEIRGHLEYGTDGQVCSATLKNGPVPKVVFDDGFIASCASGAAFERWSPEWRRALRVPDSPRALPARARTVA